MSSTTSIKLQTLKGVFHEPKMNHRRDFLRENKLNLRELQRVTNKKPSTQQNEQQLRVQRQQQQHQQQQMYVGGARRSNSQNRSNNINQSQSQARSISQQRSNNNKTQQLQQQMQLGGSTRCPSCAGSGRDLASVTSSVVSCDKEMQTDDIHDEVFLYDALKKCNSSESQHDSHTKRDASFGDSNVPHSHSKRFGQNEHEPQHVTYDSQSNYYQQEANEPQTQHQQQQSSIKEIHSRVHHHYTSEDNPLTTTRSHTSLLNGHGQGEQPQQQQQQQFHHRELDEDLLSNNLGNLDLDAGEQHEGHLSRRSRQTMCSTQTSDTSLMKKRSTGSVHKLGSRDDVRLPRYLEREKREKEEQRILEMDRDPNCPRGHFLMTAQERQAALAAAERKFQALVSELNHMPMTTETMRIRSRKNEIEKELVTLEGDIRIFSKTKVYVKSHE